MLCEKEFCIDKKSKEYKNYCKVRDHCHFTGKYRGAAHSICNLKHKVTKFVPVVLHNGSKYDNHLIIKQLAKDFNCYFSCIGENTEKYISFSVTFIKESANSNKKKKPDAYSLRFIDSFRFMNTSLDKLVKNIAEPSKYLSIDVLKERFYNTYRLCGNNEEKLKLLSRKGVYPYEYMDSWEKFKLPVPLEKENYYSELNDSNIDDGDIGHKKNVCNTFKISKLGKDHNLYVSSDTALLSDVFENFRDKCLAIGKLDPVYYLSAPAFSWHSGLKMTGQTLELLTDKNMLLLFEKGIRGGICNAICKYAKANKKYMKNYDSSKKSTYLMYVDANNLYGYAMCNKLPTGNFKWVEDLSIFTKDFIKNYSEDNNTGYLLVVDVKYPENLYRDHKYLPFLPDKTKINKVKKLTYDSHDKKEYSIYISVLKQALNHGLKLKNVHSAISFSQDNWLEPYIMRNTN